MTGWCRATVLSVLLILALARGLAAQTAPELTEREAVALALRNQPALRSAQAEAEMARARAGIARAEPRLLVSLNALTAVSDMVNAVQVPATMPQAILMSQTRNAADLNAMAMLPLATGGRLRESVRAADLTAQAAESRSAGTRVQVAYEARSRFSDWRSALAMAKVAVDARTAQQQSTAVSLQLYEAGKIPRFDLLRSEAALAAAQQQVANTTADIAAARARLAQALGVPEGTVPECAGSPQELPIPADPLATAVATRPDLLAAVQEAAAADASLRAREASYRPQIYAFGMVDAISPSDVGSITSKSIGIVAGLPLITGGLRSADLAEASAEVARARAAREGVELQVRGDVAEAEARLLAARQNLTTAAAQVESAQAAYAVAQARYSAGKSTIVELLDALRTQTEAQQSLVVAETQLGLRRADLYRAMGLEGP